MSKELTKEQYWKLFEKLPEELKTIILSEETAADIFDICDRNEMDIEQTSVIAGYIGQVLLGALPLEDLQKTLEKEIGIKKTKSKKLIQEINRFIFHPIKPLLEELYRMEILPSSPEKPSSATEAPVSEKEKSVSPRKDTYRETVE